jgi:hypothetical protein
MKSTIHVNIREETQAKIPKEGIYGIDGLWCGLKIFRKSRQILWSVRSFGPVAIETSGSVLLDVRSSSGLPSEPS